MKNFKNILVKGFKKKLKNRNRMNYNKSHMKQLMKLIKSLMSFYKNQICAKVNLRENLLQKYNLKMKFKELKIIKISWMKIF